MKNSHKNSLLALQKGRIQRSLRLLMLGGLTLLIVGVCAASIVNAWALQRKLRTSAETYVADVSGQVAKNINSHLESINNELASLADSLMRIDSAPAQLDFLARKGGLYEFDSFALIKQDGTAAYLDGTQADLSGDPGVQAALKGSASISFMDNQALLYLVPITQNDRVVGALGGLRSKENMQQLIRTNAFEGEGLSCIIDPNGEVVVSPTDLAPFLALDDLFADSHSDSAAIARDIRQMRQDMHDQRDGSFSFISLNSTPVLLVYNMLPAYDWVLLTLVSQDLIAQDSDRYVAQTFLITGLTILLFTAVLLTILAVYRRYRRQIEHFAFVDPVTGGYNNARFQLECASLFQQAAPGQYTIVSLNLKDFRLINENFGSRAGNDTLRYVLRTLSSALGPGELAARGEADNFYLCLHGCQPTAIQARLDEMIQRVNLFNQSLSSHYSLAFVRGAYVVDDPALDITVMQDRANTARKSAAAANGAQCAFFDAASFQRLRQEKELADLLDESLKNRDFQVYLQPKVRLADGRIGGAEALVRWVHPEKGVISPGDFIPLFERNGSICELDLYVFEQVCAMLRRWMLHSHDVCTVSVNLSRQHLRDPGFFSRFEAIRTRYGVPPQWLELELTESILLHKEQFAEGQAVIAQMHELGYTCSLDDFGTGYSALGLLKEFEVDAIKLDRSFFADMNPGRALDVVEAIIDLAKKLHICTVAEGIEDEAQLEPLRRMGCDLVQGYIFARPMPIPEFEAWAQAGPTHAPLAKGGR